MHVYVNIQEVFIGILHSQLVSTNGELIHIGYWSDGTTSSQAPAQVDFACVGLFNEELALWQIADVIRGCDYGKHNCASV